MTKKILPGSIDVLSEKLAVLPGIGPKTANRLVFFLLKNSDSFLQELGQSIMNLKKGLHLCPDCFLITDQEEFCPICQSESRDPSSLCVLEEPLDAVAIEQTGSFHGYYHVLGGAISPIDGIGPDQLRLKELVARVEKNPAITEVIIATNPSLEGEATALYINDHLKKFKVKVSRIARGLPIGGDLEYADEVTLQRALEGRQVVKEKEAYE